MKLMRVVGAALGVVLVAFPSFAELRISEICPRPDAKDPNGKESGWIELWNDGDAAVDLADYEIVRVNRGKALKAAGKPLASRSVPAHGYTVVYLSEEYDNADSGETTIYANDVMVCPYKVNPKKFPLVALYKGSTLLEKFIVPVDLPDNKSVAPAGGAFPAYAGETAVKGKAIAVDATPIDISGALAVDDGSGVTVTDGIYDFSSVTQQKKGLKASVGTELASTNVWSAKFSFKLKTNTASSEGGGFPLFFCRQSGTTPKSGIVVYVNNAGLIRVELRDTNGANNKTLDADSETNWFDNAWHEMKIVSARDGQDRFALSVDGVTYLDTSYSYGAGLVPSIPVCFGHAYDSTYWDLYDGAIKDVAFYKGTLIGRAAQGGGGMGLDSTVSIVTPAAVSRVILPTITKGKANNRAGELAVGPNAGPLYGLKHSFSDWKSFAPAKAGTAYDVTLAVNPLSDAADDAVTGVTLLYRADFGTIGSVAMTKGAWVDGQGQLWTAQIPAAAIPAAGHLIRWAAQVTDAAENVWRTPSFRNPDDGYQWYGTIVEPTADQVSATLQTWHVFADQTALDNMDKQYDSVKGALPLGARVGIFDSQTSNYYDNVRIDLRGNTTAKLTKKSHGLKFSKVHPMTCENPFDHEKIECRKTSLLAEYADPSRVRSSLSMKIRRLAGQDVPFGYPIRVQLNGAFYQLDHHTNRFTDELLEDYFGYDPFGYAWKNVGTVGGTATGGSTDQTLPDDGTSVTSTYNTFKNSIQDVAAYTPSSSGLSAAKSNTVNKAVVKQYDLPAWINFLALSHFTQEGDDGWANLCLYYDRLGTGTWRPMAYDLHQSFGAYYANDGYTDPKRQGCWAEHDEYGKSHPLYGGMHIVTTKFQGDASRGNRAYEAVYQNAKYRRLHNRRLRTLMDQILKAPGTAKADTPFWTDIVEPMVAAMQADNALDRNKWGLGTSAPIYVWSSSLTFEHGVADLWDNYVVPRRRHLFVTHSVTNTAFAGGYARDKNAEIPLAQSATAALKAKFSITAVPGGAVVRNLNEETVDMSGWKLSGAMSYTFPAGAVIDRAFGATPGEVFVVSNRIAYVAANDATLTDQVILGNASAGTGDVYGLKDVDGNVVIEAVEPPPTHYTGDFDEPVEILVPGEYEFENANLNAGLVLGEGVYEIKNTKNAPNTASNIVCAGTLVFKGKGSMTIEGKKLSGTLIDTVDLIVSNGTLSVESKATTSETAAIKVAGNFAVEDKGTLVLKLTKNAAQGRGVQLTEKDKFCRIGDGGTFIAELNGPGTRAIQCSKGSVNLEILSGATVAVTNATTATDGRIFKMDGKIKVKGGKVNVLAQGANTEIFSAEKTVEISGGTVELASTEDCISAQKGVVISGGRFYGVSSGGDVIDSNANIDISGGVVLAYTTAVEEDQVGSFGLDVPTGCTINLTGGTVAAIGGVNAHCGTLAGSQNAFLVTGADASAWSSKYLSFARKIGAPLVTTTVGLPAIGVATCTVLYSVPGIASGAQPSVSATAPTEGSLGFHETYETSYVRPVPVVEGGEVDAAAGADFTRAKVDATLALSSVTASTSVKGVLTLRNAAGVVVKTVTNDFAQAAEAWTTSFALEDLLAGERYAFDVKACDVWQDEWTELASETGSMALEAETGWKISYDGETSVGGTWRNLGDDGRLFTADEPSTPKSLVTLDLNCLFSSAVSELPDPAAWTNAQAALIPFELAGVRDWRGLVQGGWEQLSGAPVTLEEKMDVRMILDYRGATPTVTYLVQEGGAYVALTNAEGQSAFAPYTVTNAMHSLQHQEGVTLSSFSGVATDSALAQLGDSRYRTLAEALAAAKASGTELKLLWDATLPSRVASFKHGDSVRVDLNGHTFAGLAGWRIVPLDGDHIRLVYSRPLVLSIH